MRIVSSIKRPFADEHVIGVDPPIKPALEGVWRRRINAFNGRPLSDRALTAEQDSRAGAQRLRGQSVTAGVVHGLDAALETGALGAAPAQAVVQILPGFALTRAGEDVAVPAPRRIAIGALPVYARVDILDAIASGGPAPADGGDGGTLLPRRIGPPLNSLLAAPAAAALPRVAILAAEPVTVTILAGARDNCPHDPRDDPYDDLQRIDGARLVLWFWPAELRGANAWPDYSLPAEGPERRNQLAYRIFAAEQELAQGAMHPWEQLGAPIALVAFKADWALDFVDRAAVVRLGGQPNPRTPLAPGNGTPLLWQARVAQFVEQLSEMEDLSPAALTAAFGQLPPVGFLPSSLVDLAARRQHMFPAGFALTAAPAPLEHLDFAVRESAGLAPINLDAPDAVEILVPVPERFYEPGLLLAATIDPVFAQAIARYVEDRTNWLIRREMVRRRRDLLIDAATGTRPSAPASDLPPAEAAPNPQESAPALSTRVRRVEAGQAARVLLMLGSGSSLSFADGDRVSCWVRIANAANLRGLSIRFGANTAAATGAANIDFGVFWGAPDGLPVGAGDNNIAARRQSDLPPQGVWTRLEAPANARWTAAGAPLTGLAANGLELAQFGGTIEWGAIGKIDRDGAETVWVADDAPPGAALRDSAANAPGWPQAPARADEPPVEVEAGTGEAGGVRTVNAIESFRGRWPQAFLANEFAELSEGGIDGFLRIAEARLKATNDAVDLGFVRARSDIYRVRQFMLGGDAASRLVTSPALADTALREESARAKNVDLAAFLKTAYQTDFRRDPDQPLETKPKQTGRSPASRPSRQAAALAAKGESGSALFLNGLRISRFSDAATAQPFTRPVTRPVTPPVTRPFVFGGRPGVLDSDITIGVRDIPTIGVEVGPSITESFEGPVAKPFVSIAGFRADVVGRGFQDIDIQAQLPLPGAVERTVSVAERLRPPPAVEAHGYAVAGKYAVVNAIAGLLGDPAKGVPPKGIALGDLPAPGFRYKKEGDPPAPRRKNTIGDVIFDRDANQARDYDDLDERKESDQRHEADYFTASVNAIDNSIALMRLIEGRVDLYNKLLADARETRAEIANRVKEADERLRAIDVEVEEARHDVAVATSLLAEERDRIEQLNARRAAILKANVKTILFRRPRKADRPHAAPAAPAGAALAEPPVSVCLRNHASAPEELRDYAALLRDAPVAWFPAVKARLDLIDRLDSARKFMVAVRLRAETPLDLSVAPASQPPKMLAAAYQLIDAQRSIIGQRRLAALQIDLAGAVTSEISRARSVLADRASLADLIAGDHNRLQLSRLAATEIESIAQVAECLHASFGEAPPAIRLKWAELLSEFDSPAPLASLAALPGWNALALDLRRAQQDFVDWLFSRIDRNIAPAEAAINELVRIALLLAAHAPVDRIIPARLIAPAPVRVGARLDLAVDLRHARIGMTALVRGADSAPVAHAVVDDLAEGAARARIVKVFAPAATLAAGLRIDLSDAQVG